VAPTAVAKGLEAGYREVSGLPFFSLKEYPETVQVPWVTGTRDAQVQFRENTRGTLEESEMIWNWQESELAASKELMAFLQSLSARSSLQGIPLSLSREYIPDGTLHIFLEVVNVT
jgi:hypothetical protein